MSQIRTRNQPKTHFTGISVAITIFNESRTEILRALNSVLKQTSNAEEILIMDDGSKDRDTLATIEEIAGLHKRVTIFSKRNEGVVAARNDLLKQMKFSHALFLDADDELARDYVAKAKTELYARPDSKVLFPNVLITKNCTSDIWLTGPFDLSVLRDVNTIPNSSVVSVGLLKSVGGYSSDFEEGFEDWDLWVRVAKKAKLMGFTNKLIHLPMIGYQQFQEVDGRSAEALKSQQELRGRIIKRAEEWHP